MLDSILLDGCRIGRGARVRRAVIGAGARSPTTTRSATSARPSVRRASPARASSSSPHRAAAGGRGALETDPGFYLSRPSGKARRGPHSPLASLGRALARAETPPSRPLPARSRSAARWLARRLHRRGHSPLALARRRAARGETPPSRPLPARSRSAARCARGDSTVEATPRSLRSAARWHARRLHRRGHSRVASLAARTLSPSRPVGILDGRTRGTSRSRPPAPAACPRPPSRSSAPARTTSTASTSAFRSARLTVVTGVSRLGQVEPRLRRALRRGAAPLRRELLGLRAAVPRPHGEAARRAHRRHPARRSPSTSAAR